MGELRRALSPSYSVCILERRLERRSTSAEISIISARGRYASSPSPATKWTDCSASPEVFILHPLEEMIQHFVFRRQLIPTPSPKKRGQNERSIYPVLAQKDKDLKENMPGGEFVKWTF